MTWCETPRPSTIRPPENSSIVAAVCAIAAGVREKIGTTPVPSRTRSVTEATGRQDRQRVATGDVGRVDAVEPELVGEPRAIER